MSIPEVSWHTAFMMGSACIGRQRLMSTALLVRADEVSEPRHCIALWAQSK